MKPMFISLAAVAGLASVVIARDDKPPQVDPVPIPAGDLMCRSAAQRGLALVTRAAVNWQENKKTCFACHHHTLPMLAMVEAGRAGLALDESWMKSQSGLAQRYFEGRVKDMDEGGHVPGGAATVGYGLWALSLAKHPPDATTTAMANYLLQIQGVQKLRGGKQDKAEPRDGRWMASCRRAPMQASEVGDTVLVLIGLERYATDEQRAKLATARASAEKYLAQAQLRNLQDRLWRLWGLHQLGGDAKIETAVRDAIFKLQHADGGWSQNDEDAASDAYSTGQTLFMLRQTGAKSDDAAVQRARDYLFKTQDADGSWLVESRVSHKAQPYFDNGDPHGEHQFLSVAATAWATAGLAQLLQPAGRP